MVGGCRKSQRTSRAPRRSRAVRRQSRASASGAPLGQQAQRGSSSPAPPKLPKQNARQRRSAQRSAEYHRARADAAASASVTASVASTALSAAAAPSSPSKRERGDGEPPLNELPLVPGGEVPAAGALPQRPAKGLRAGFLLGLLVPFGLTSSCESERKNRADRACARDGTSHPAPVSSPLYFSGCYLHLVAACAVLLCPSLMCGDVG